MTDTESRLRDYLDTKAATVPDDEQGPGLLAETTHRRSLWPVLAAAAAVAAVLALTVAVLPMLTDDKPAPAAPPAADAPAKLPYIVHEAADVPKIPNQPLDRGRSSTLYDGDRTLRLPDGIHRIRGRVADGWLAEYFDGKESRVVILQANGKYRDFGPRLANAPTLSPDGRQVAMLVPERVGDEKGRIAVFDLASGKQVSSVPVPRTLSVLSGWNSRGIFSFSDISGKYELFVVQPGNAEFQSVPLPGFQGGTIATSPGTDVLSVFTASAGNQCVEAGVIRGSKFDVLRKYCERGERAVYPVLSADGRTVLYTETNKAIDIATGKATKLQVPDPIVSFPPGAFEDATHALVVTQRMDGRKFGPQRLYRCDVATGKCALLRTEKSSNQITVVER